MPNGRATLDHLDRLTTTRDRAPFTAITPRSAHKLHMLTGTEISFILTCGGHNAGSISERGHLHRHYRTEVREQSGPARSPEDRKTHADLREGTWLKRRSSAPIAPPPIGAPEPHYPPPDDAPERYRLER